MGCDVGRGGTVIREVEAFRFSVSGCVTGKGIAGVVPDPWYVHHPKAITQGLLLEFLNRVLGMSSRDLSPNSFRSGL